MNDLNQLLELIRSGEYTAEELRDFLESLRRSRLGEDARLRILSEAFNNIRSARNLLSLIFGDPETVCEVLQNKIGIPHSPVLAKANIVCTLYKGTTRFKTSYNDILYLITVPHHAVSLYNPLLMLYIVLNDPGIFKREILGPIMLKTVYYEALPGKHRVILFRDVLETIAMLSDEHFIDTLYREMRTDWLKERISPKKISVSTKTKIAVLISYVRVVRGLMSTIRGVLRGRTRLEEFNKRISRLGKDTLLYDVLRSYSEFYSDTSGKSLEKLTKWLKGLIGVGVGEVSNVITSFSEETVSSSMLGEREIYYLLTLIVEYVLFEEELRSAGTNYFRESDLEYLDKYVGRIVESLKSRREDVLRTISIGEAPYTMLRDRLKEKMRHRFLEWLSEAISPL